MSDWFVRLWNAMPVIVVALAIVGIGVSWFAPDQTIWATLGAALAAIAISILVGTFLFGVLYSRWSTSRGPGVP